MLQLTELLLVILVSSGLFLVLQVDIQWSSNNSVLRRMSRLGLPLARCIRVYCSVLMLLHVLALRRQHRDGNASSHRSLMCSVVVECQHRVPWSPHLRVSLVVTEEVESFQLQDCE